MTSPSPALSRRALARGAAWSVPALTLSAAAPVLAASPTGCPVTWYAESRTNLSLPDFSNNGYTAIYVNHTAAVQPGYLKVMHWASPDNTTLFWRPALGVGTEHTDSVITFTIPEGQVLDTVSFNGNQFDVGRFNAFTSSPAGAYSVEMAQWVVSQSGNTVTLMYAGPLPAHSGAGWVFTSKPVGGGAIDPNTDYTASATYTARTTCPQA